MRTDCASSTTSRVSCFSNMNDIQNPNSFDFVPKSDYNEKWHLDNKCLFHNQQANFLEGDACKFRKNNGKAQISCDICKCLDDKFKVLMDKNTFKKKSGDWSRDDELIEYSSETLIQKPSNPDWKRKRLHNASNYDRRNRNSFTLDDCSINSLRDERNKVENCYEERGKDRRKRFLHSFREYLVNYQESCGVPRTEYPFSSLIQLMGQATGRSLLALLYVMLHIVPLAEVLLYVLRFVLDKVITIKSSQDFRQAMLRCFVFTTELLSIYICLLFIFGFIVLPILQMVIGITGKILLYS